MTEDEAVCDEEVNIILMTNEYEILICEMETNNAFLDTASRTPYQVKNGFKFYEIFRWHCFE